jgi:hypothetical protein
MQHIVAIHAVNVSQKVGACLPENRLSKSDNGDHYQVHLFWTQQCACLSGFVSRLPGKTPMSVGRDAPVVEPEPDLQFHQFPGIRALPRHETVQG